MFNAGNVLKKKNKSEVGTQVAYVFYCQLICAFLSLSANQFLFNINMLHAGSRYLIALISGIFSVCKTRMLGIYDL